jgi:hypothetical protein
MHSLFVRGASLALLVGGLFVPVSALAASPSTPTSTSDADTGTIVGAVTCGPAEEAPAVNIVVTAVGSDLKTLTSSDGRFQLSGLPAGQTFTIDAIADPEASFVSSRYNVTVQHGQTLDIGAMDLGICGQPTQPSPTQNGQSVGSADSNQSNADFTQN